MEIYLTEFLLIATIHFLALLSPGADFVYLVNSGLNNKLKISIGVSVGIAFSNGFYILLCLFGYATIVSQSMIIMTLIKIIGGIYLIYLSYFIFSNKSDFKRVVQKESSFKREFINSFLISIFNPKISIFYISLFTLIISKDTPWMIQFFYGMWMILAVFIWDTLILLLLNHKNYREKILSISSLQNVMALLLLLMGISLLVTLI